MLRMQLLKKLILYQQYSEKIIKVSSDRIEPVQVTLSATEPINSWLSFEPATFPINRDTTAEFNVIIEPSNAPLGLYQGYIIINTISEGNELTTAVVTSLDLETTIKITDQEITQAVIKDVVIQNIEQNNPIKVSVILENQGNIMISPFFQINILNSDKSQILKSAVSKEKTILPSVTDSIELEMPNDLGLGAYWAQITVFLEDGWITGKQLIKFNIVEPGALPSEEKPLPIFKKEPVFIF